MRKHEKMAKYSFRLQIGVKIQNLIIQMCPRPKNKGVSFIKIVVRQAEHTSREGGANGVLAPPPSTKSVNLKEYVSARRTFYIHQMEQAKIWKFVKNPFASLYENLLLNNSPLSCEVNFHP